MTQPKRARITARSWVEIAAGALAERGPAALTIEALCQKARKTKGSFYAHFADYDAFLSALTAHWREIGTEAIKRAVDAAPATADRLGELNRQASMVDARLDLGMRRLAETSPIVLAAVMEADRARIAYLAGLYVATKGLSKSDATDFATIEYAAFVGLQAIGPKRDTDELRRLYEVFRKFTAGSIEPGRGRRRRRYRSIADAFRAMLEARRERRGQRGHDGA